MLLVLTLLRFTYNSRAPPDLSTPSVLPTITTTYSQAVKAMRYGTGGGATKEFTDATALREKLEEELQAALEEEDEF